MMFVFLRRKGFRPYDQQRVEQGGNYQTYLESHSTYQQIYMGELVEKDSAKENGLWEGKALGEISVLEKAHETYRRNQREN